jgi:hypothetical protein
MQHIIVSIVSKGFAGLSSENIEQALHYYFSSPALGVHFEVIDVTHDEDLQLIEPGPKCPACGQRTLGNISIQSFNPDKGE